jgi:hypothetical protein
MTFLIPRDTLRCRLAQRNTSLRRPSRGADLFIFQPAEKNESGANGVLRRESVTCGSARNYVQSRPLLDARKDGGRFSRVPFFTGVLRYYGA